MLQNSDITEKTTYTMFCFCYNELMNNPLETRGMTFTEFAPDAENYCDIFLDDYALI
jgi:hypothetical protein